VLRSSAETINYLGRIVITTQTFCYYHYGGVLLVMISLCEIVLEHIDGGYLDSYIGALVADDADDGFLHFLVAIELRRISVGARQHRVAIQSVHFSHETYTYNSTIDRCDALMTFSINGQCAFQLMPTHWNNFNKTA